MRFILGFFGYCKIPIDAIQLSIQQEDFLKDLQKMYKDKQHGDELFQHHLSIQRAITGFLRSGRLLR